MQNNGQPMMQAADAIVKAIDRLKKEVRPTAAEIPSGAISGETTIEDALEYLDDNKLGKNDYPFVRNAGTSPGGTTSGDGTNKVTFTAPGQYRHALMMFGAEMINLYHTTASTSTVYSGTVPTGWALTKEDDVYTLTRTATTAFRYVVLWI